MTNHKMLKKSTRRHFFQSAGFGIGSLAMASITNPRLFAQAVASKAPHFAPKAKNIIFLFMAGGPSQLDLFDGKPDAEPVRRAAMPRGPDQGRAVRVHQGRTEASRLAAPVPEIGQSGAELSNLLPHLSTIVDDVAIVKSMHTTQFNHAPAQIFMNTGHQIPGRPSMGAWLTYGIGSESKRPAWVCGSAFGQERARWRARRAGDQGFFRQRTREWSSGGPASRSCSSRILTESAVETRRRSLDHAEGISTRRTRPISAIRRLHRGSRHTNLRTGCSSACPNWRTFRKNRHRFTRCTAREPGKNSFANNCLLARRLVERGVRMVELFPPRLGHARRTTARKIS